MSHSFLVTLVRIFTIRIHRLVTSQDITDGPSRVYCGMGYSGLSCEDVYINNVATRNKSGYYRINNNNEWVYCNMTAIAIAFSRGDLISSCVGVDEGVDGIWKRIASFKR